MSLADVNWLRTVIAHFHCLHSIYTLTESTSAKTEVMHHANKFVRFASRKLTPKRLQQLQAVLLLAHCHVLIHENNDQLAHQKLMQSLSHFYDELFECPPVLLVEYLPALALFGEQQIHTTIVNVLKARGIKNLQASHMDSFNLLKQSNLLGGTQTIAKDSQSYLKHYPYSSEAKIALIHLYGQRDKALDSDKIASIVSELSVLELPPNWRNWLTTGQQHGYAATPPVAFSLAARDQKGV